MKGDHRIKFKLNQIKINNLTSQKKKLVAMIPILMGIIVLMTIGCYNKEVSPIEILFLDQKIIEEIKNPENSDSMYVEYPKRKDFWSIEHYIIKPNKENAIFKDSLGAVVGYWKRINGKNYEGAECYPNGQIIGELNYSEPGVFDGEAKYYYKDGRIRSKGNWKGFKQIGTWKNYKENGELESIREFDKNGKLLKEEKIKTNR